VVLLYLPFPGKGMTAASIRACVWCVSMCVHACVRAFAWLRARASAMLTAIWLEGMDRFEFVTLFVAGFRCVDIQQANQ